MNISPDEIVLFKIPANIFGRRFYIDINMTLVGTWGIMLFLWLFFRYITKNFNSSFKMTRLQNMVEVLVKFLREQVEMMMKRKADDFIPLIGSLFIFILVANWSSLLPIPFYVNNNLEWYLPPTSSISTTTGLSIVVMSSVIVYGMAEQGIFGYFKRFFEPIFILFPLNILSEISSFVSLAIRLYGNIMSGGLLASILFVLAPLVLPGLINIYGLLAGTIQPYIFSVLAMVYISAGMGGPSESEMEELETLELERI
ncbi:MAG: F0F1 ATP synthase subunit A [Alphaproteobacteria bacterium]|nr:F0F1 ATP synthase subunit A [Alphaproteobacteria bacterium]